MRPAALAAALLVLGACSGAGAEGVASETVVLTAHHSAFSPGVVEVGAGTTVRFVVENRDPIDHELIVGDHEVHRIHEAGTHGSHGTVPGEVSVPAGETRSTTYRFDEPGVVEFACHLPGHYAYGMRGEVRVSSRR